MPEESTTPDPAELTRRAFEAVNQRDIDAVMSFFAPHAVLDGRAVGGVYEGRAAIRGFLDDWFASFAELRMEVEEFAVLDDGVVLAVVNQRGSSGRRRWSSPSAGGMGHLLVGRWPPRAIDDQHRHRRGPCCRRTARRVEAVGVASFASRFARPSSGRLPPAKRSFRFSSKCNFPRRPAAAWRRFRCSREAGARRRPVTRAPHRHRPRRAQSRPCPAHRPGLMVQAGPQASGKERVL